ncbi:acylphosphatase [Candidatus Woesebacteria bacterium RBG_19FT_COMBO_47_8]|uniref:acylphosphatase n=1 Tax=Candidatus Woesebacteria bacterium RBG_13_46_13 TaxID=1802479 RepID=A0A1F7X4U6_9BACT|nr:MAG: acylphosphatase [Candidatus Woesebacteria bacterium RBG_13_46_13]OGM17498.1 MAG: acylphosphatase [Candidatus Woesebacteria bacterium RBG_19FT_COMBO_47_8]HJX59241.1 acylphosphatase [Patescibacteria group bacterium]
MDSIRAHLYVEGRVQGVFFRDWTKKRSQELTLTGWVSNLADGKVEAVLEGSKGKVKEMVKSCQAGPRLAKVIHVDVVFEKATGEFSDFEIR